MTLSRRAALLLLAVVAAAAVWSVGQDLRSGRAGPVWSAPWWLLFYAAFAVHLWSQRRTHRPGRLEPGPRGLVAPADHLAPAALAAGMLALVAAFTGNAFIGPGTALSAVYVVLVVLMVPVAAIAVGNLLRSAGRLELRPEGLRIVDVLATTDVPWEAVGAGPDPGPGPLGTARLLIARPDLIRRRGLGDRHPTVVRLPLQMSAVRRETVVDAINHHLLHPEARAAF